MHISSEIKKIAFLGDYLPRKCGIATFTTDLNSSIMREFPELQCLVVPVNDTREGYDYPAEARFEISEQDLSSYLQAADFLNITNVDILCVQHEFGIYGGVCGSHLLALLHELRMPIVTTLHTILMEPSHNQRRVMGELIRLSTRLIVMSNKGKDILTKVYAAPPEKIDLIPHGIPETPFADPNFFKDEFGVAGKQVILTFGLLSPNKGIEYALRALPGIIKAYPEIVFIIAGQTHPNLIKEEGEVYRLGLELLARDLGVSDHVVFFNRFVELDELIRFIGAADIYLTQYLTESQITSGTLSYAFGMGNAVISTPYWHAIELLDQDRGKLIPFKDSAAIETAVIQLLENEPLRHAMRKKAYAIGREMIWPEVAKQYLTSFLQARQDHNFIGRISSPIKTLDQKPGQLPIIKLEHLYRMSDSTGIFQHAQYSVPNYIEGYCTDDNARALLLTFMLQETGNDTPRVKDLSSVYAAFLNHAYDSSARRFRNFMTFDRRWVNEPGSEDCTGQALWALGYCVGHSSQGGFQMLAAELFEHALPTIPTFTSPRAWAFTLIGIHEYMQRLCGDRRASQIRNILVKKLVQRYNDAAGPDWQWFEDTVTYANAKLSHALIVSGSSMDEPKILELGLTTLRWLISIQTGESGSFRPIGSNGFYQKGKPRALYDQQPIEAQATISACIEAFKQTGDNFWVTEANRCFEWFLGRNDLGLIIYDPSSGGCRDGLHIDRISQNQGAESSLAFLLSLVEMQNLQSILTSFKNTAVQP